MIFADAFYWLALANPLDGAHARAINFSNSYSGRLLTTEWVLAETCDGLSSLRVRHLVRQLRLLWSDDADLIVVPASHNWFERGLNLHNARPDKEWSLTDCISFEVMREHGVAEALTGDRHFAQAGFVPLLAS